jgi:putative oxidoreductase
MIHTQTASLAALLLRLSMGIMLIAHGFYLKIFVFTMAGAMQGFEGMGLPGWFAWVVMLYETIGGILMILGLFNRWNSLFQGVSLLFAAYLGHWANGWLFSNPNGGWEFPVFWAIVCFSLALLGEGKYALKTGSARA